MHGMAQDIVTLAIRNCHLVIFVQSPEDGLNYDAYSELFQRLNLPVTKCNEEFVDLFILERLTNDIGPPRDGHRRKVVLLCGMSLEEQISVSAHHLLMNGYETYLIRDQIVARDPSNCHIHDHRLTTAGAVSVTARQLVYEWIASESEPHVRSLLTEFVVKR
jgi:hypothetical protein